MIVDTSFLVALFLPEDVHHQKAVSLLQKNKNHVLIIADRIIEEMLTVLIYKRNSSYALRILHKLQSNKMVQIYSVDSAVQRMVFDLIKKVGKRLSFADYVVVFLAQCYGVDVLCFDKEIKKAVKKK